MSAIADQWKKHFDDLRLERILSKTRSDPGLDDINAEYEWIKKKLCCSDDCLVQIYEDGEVQPTRREIKCKWMPSA